MQHFFVDASQVSEETIRIEGSDVNHMKNVLRMRIGEEVTVSDGQGKERAVIFPAIQGGFRDIQPIKVIQRESVGQHTFRAGSPHFLHIVVV
mgnify:FL=1